MSKAPESIKAYLIGQIGKNYSSLVSIGLSEILTEVYGIISAAQHLVGGRAVILECEDAPKLVALYEKNGFKRLLTENESGLITMYTYIK